MTSNWPKPASRVQKIRILFFTIFTFGLFGRCFFKSHPLKIYLSSQQVLLMPLAIVKCLQYFTIV